MIISKETHFWVITELRTLCRVVRDTMAQPNINQALCVICLFIYRTPSTKHVVVLLIRL